MNRYNRRMTSEELASRIQRRLASDDSVGTVWIFGSEEIGRARASSDLDVAVLFSKPAAPSELLRLRASLEEATGRSVDLVDLRDSSPILATQVVRHGRVIVDRDRIARAEFVASLPSRRYDVIRVRREAERRLIKRMSHGRA